MSVPWIPQPFLSHWPNTPTAISLKWPGTNGSARLITSKSCWNSYLRHLLLLQWSAESVVPVETSAETESAETAAETIAAEESETEAAVETTIDDILSSDTATVQTQTEEGIAVQAIETDTAIEDNAADSDADIEVAVESLDDAQPVAVSPAEEPLTESSARVLVEAAIQEVQNDAAQSSADNDQNTDAIT